MPNPAGKIYTFVGLFPIRKKIDLPGFRQDLRSLARDPAGSPLSAIKSIHSARLVIVDEAFSEGMPEPPEQLADRYLLFACCYDGRNLSDLTDQIATEIPNEVFHRIWGKCRDCPNVSRDATGKDNLARYFRSHQLSPNFFTSLLPDRTVPQILWSLELKKRFANFVADKQTLPPKDLKANFRQFWNSCAKLLPPLPRKP